MYGPSEMLQMPTNITVVSIALLFGGLSSAHTIIPTLPEIVEAGKDELHYPEDILHDFSAGLFNMNFAIGEILGPLIGNQLYVSYGMKQTGDVVGMSVIMFGITYFIFCDISMPWNRTQLTKIEEEEYLKLAGI